MQRQARITAVILAASSYCSALAGVSVTTSYEYADISGYRTYDAMGFIWGSEPTSRSVPRISLHGKAHKLIEIGASYAFIGDLKGSGEAPTASIFPPPSPLAVVTPTLQVGVSYHHMIFPGSLTISEDTMVSWCYDIAASLKYYGVPLVFFLNGHWGNKTALALATRKIRNELGIKTISISYWDLYPDEHRNLVEDGEIPDHAAEFETSLGLALREDLVKKDWTRDPDAYSLTRKKMDLFLTADDQNPVFGSSKDGLLFGNPSKATREKGEKMIEVISDSIVSFLNDLLETYL